MDNKFVRKVRRFTGSLSRDTAIVSAVVGLLLFVTFVTTVVIVTEGANRQEVIYDAAVWRDQPRLSHFAIPYQYNITLTVDVSKDTFGGVEDIDFNVTENGVSLIILHARNLNITSVELANITMIDGKQKKEPEKISVPRFHPWSPHSYLVVYLDKYIDKGSYRMSLKWHSALKKGYTGLYLNDMKSDDEKLVSSQFQASHAREVFPCFDEPDLKAVFYMTIEVESTYKTVLWNTKEIKTVRVPGRGLNSSLADDKRDVVVHEFEKSPVMSSYLVAFVIGNLNAVNTTYTSQKGREVIIRVWGRDDLAKENSAYALNISKGTLMIFEELYDEEYPLTKCDMVGVPSFQAGAMENWGLIIYRESYLFYNKKTDKTSVKGDVNLVVAHELAHMWFGNLVTMKWWNDIWLNEGFATYAQGLATTRTADWDNQGFLMEEFRKRALMMDVFTSSRPASLPESSVNPDEAHNYFDNIAYNKGATILNQLDVVLKSDNFKAGLGRYIDTFKNSNANQTQLWEILDAASNFTAENNFTLGSFMDTWTLQMNLPVVSIEKLTGKKFILSQKRFVIKDEYSKDSPSPYNYQWYVPIKARFYTEGTNRTYNAWLKPDSELILDVDSFSDGDFWFINDNGDGYYITRYSLELWDGLIARIKAKLNEFSVREQLILLQDTDYLVKAGYYPIDHQIQILNIMFNNSNNYNVLKETMAQIYEIHGKLEKSANETVVEKWDGLWNARFGVLAKRYLKDNTDDYALKLLRSSVFRYCSRLAVEYCTSEAKTMWNNTVVIHPDYKSTVYVVTMREAENQQKQWEDFQKIFLATKLESEQDILKDALAATTDKQLIERYIDMCMNSSMIQPGEGLYIMGRTIAPASPMSANTSTWFMLNNFDKIMETFKGIDLARRDYVQRVVSVAPQEILEKVFKKFEDPTDGYLVKYKDLRNDYLAGKSEALSRNNWISKYQNDILNYSS